MTSKIKSIIKNVLLVILVILLLSGGIALLRLCISDEPASDEFSVIYDNNTYTAESDIITLSAGTNTFTVNNGGNYSVKVIAGIVDFEFTVNNEKYKFSEIEDLTYAFDMSLSANYFTFNNNADYSYFTVLKAIYGTAELSEITDSVFYYTIVVTSVSGKTINLSIALSPYYTVTLNDSSFVF